MGLFSKRVKNNDFDAWNLQAGQKAVKNGEAVTINGVRMQNGQTVIDFTYDETGEEDITFAGCNLYVSPDGDDDMDNTPWLYQ